MTDERALYSQALLEKTLEAALANLTLKLVDRFADKDELAATRDRLARHEHEDERRFETILDEIRENRAAIASEDRIRAIVLEELDGREARVWGLRANRAVAIAAGLALLSILTTVALHFV